MPIRVVSKDSRFYGEQQGNEAKDRNNSDTKAKIKGDTSPQTVRLSDVKEIEEISAGRWSRRVVSAVEPDSRKVAGSKLVSVMNDSEARSILRLNRQYMNAATKAVFFRRIGLRLLFAMLIAVASNYQRHRVGQSLALR